MKRIAIIAGGYSSEFFISVKSAKAVYSFLDRTGFHLYLVLITKEKWVVLLEDKTIININKNNFSFWLYGKLIRFDFAYITIHGTPGEDGLLQGYLEMLKIPYSGCGVLTSSLTFNKYYCNNYLKRFGVKTAESICLKQGEKIFFEKIISELGFPVFVKPNCGGSSIGTTKANTILELQTSIVSAFEECNEILIECFMIGKEITCGCYKTKIGKQIIFPITEIIPPKNSFFDFNAKYGEEMAEEITPARLSNGMTNEIQILTKNIYEWIGAKGIIRVDYIISPKNEVQFLEVNTIPGMTDISLIPKQIRAAGLNIQKILTEIVECI